MPESAHLIGRAAPPVRALVMADPFRTRPDWLCQRC
jgi:hypothetical protein